MASGMTNETTSAERTRLERRQSGKRVVFVLDKGFPHKRNRDLAPLLAAVSPLAAHFGNGELQIKKIDFPKG
jgi:hypothetical protein